MVTDGQRPAQEVAQELGILCYLQLVGRHLRSCEVAWGLLFPLPQGTLLPHALAVASKKNGISENFV